MNLPFSIDQFLGVFETYNRSVWPAQIIAYALGIAAVLFSLKKVEHSDRIVSAILAFFWLWIGIAYHLVFFARINPAARLFGILFIVQGLLFLWAGIFRNSLSFAFRANVYGWTGALFILYAMLIYPILGFLQGHGYPQSPSFGITPCPGTIFTFGLLLWTLRPVKKYLLIIPFLWSLVGAFAAFSLGIREDLGLLAAGVIGTVMIVMRDRKAGS
ncbi:MAG: DUF6064 family protein [Candidatus Latescibacterota bacterium]